MALTVYKTKKDWIDGNGRACDGMGDVDERYHCMVLSDKYGISLFVGRSADEVYVRNNLQTAQYYTLVEKTRKIVAYLDEKGKGIPKDIVLWDSQDGEYLLNGETIKEDNPINSVIRDIFKYSCNAIKFSFPSEIKKVYNTYLYTSEKGNISVASLLTQQSFKDF